MVGIPFQKGKSGNPGGRSKVDMEMKALAAEYSREAILRLAEAMRSKDHKVATLAAGHLLDRAHGKPTQMMASDESMGGLVVTLLNLKDATPEQLQELRRDAASS